MTTPDATGADPRMGARPARHVHSGCKTCHHPKALHSNGATPCTAFACTAGPDGTPCQEYVAAAAAGTSASVPT